MIRSAIIILSVLFAVSTAYADEMTVTLTSGTTIIIQYHGKIDGVSVSSGKDAIASMTTIGNSSQEQADSSESNSGHNSSGDVGTKEKDSKGFKWKWADPQDEVLK